MTKGDRRAGSGQDFSGFHILNNYGLQALKDLVDAVKSNMELEGIDLPAMVLKHPTLLDKNLDDRYALSAEYQPEKALVSSVNRVVMKAFMEASIVDTATTSVKTFLNRLLGSPPLLQNAIYELFEKRMQYLIFKAQQEGKYDQGYEDIHGRSTELLEKKLLYADPVSNYTIHQSTVMVDRGISWEEVEALYKRALPILTNVTSKEEEVNEKDTKEATASSTKLEGANTTTSSEVEAVNATLDVKVKVTATSDEEDAEEEEATSSSLSSDEDEDERKAFFAISRSKMNSEYNFILVVVHESGKCSIYRPNTGRSLKTEYEEDILSRFSEISLKAAKKGWERTFLDAASHCIHWTGCKAGQGCRVGKRIVQHTILTGTLLPLWNLLEKAAFTTEETAMEVDDENKNLSRSKNFRIMRVCLAHNERMVGVSFPSSNLPLLVDILESNRLQCAELKVHAIVEEITPVDEKAVRTFTQTKRTIHSFFKPITNGVKIDPFSNGKRAQHLINKPVSSISKKKQKIIEKKPKKTTHSNRMSKNAIEFIDLISDDE